MRNKIVIMYKGRERVAFAAEIVNGMRDVEAFAAMEKKYPDAEVIAVSEDSIYRRRYRPNRKSRGGQNAGSDGDNSHATADEFGALKGTPEWDALPSSEKSAITKARNKAAKASENNSKETE
jgi:hypothetical protein